MAPGTPGPSGPKAPLEPFPVPQRTLDLRREEVYLRITLSSCVASGDASFDAARALETATRRALFSAHGVVGGGSVATEVLEATTTSSGDDGENGGGSKPTRDPPTGPTREDSEEDTEEENTGKILHLVGVVKAPRDAERKIASALLLCRHPERARVVARADDLVALGMDARALMRRAVRGERGERER